MISTMRMKVHVPLCNNHRNHWFTRGLIIWLGLVGLVVLVTIAIVATASSNNGQRNDSIMGMVFAASAPASLIWLITVIVMQSRAIRPTEINDRTITLTNVAPEFAEAVERLGPGNSYPSPRGDNDDDWDEPSPRDDDDQEEGYRSGPPPFPPPNLPRRGDDEAFEDRSRR